MTRARNYDFFGIFTYFVPSVADMFILLGMLLFGVVLGNLASLAVMLVPGAGMSMAMLVAYPVMFIPAMLYASVQSRRKSYNSGGILLDNGNFAPVGGFLCAAAAVAATFCVAFCSDAFSLLLPEPGETFKNLMESMTQSNFVLNFISVSIFAPVFEEWLCRGMVLRGLLGHGVRPVWAIAVSAAFFALIHLNPWQAVPAFLIGSLMGYVYYRTGSLKLTMLMHFANNTLSLALSNIDSLKDMDTWMDVIPSDYYWLLFAAALLLAVLCIRLFGRIPCGRRGAAREVPPLFESDIDSTDLRRP